MTEGEHLGEILKHVPGGNWYSLQIPDSIINVRLLMRFSNAGQPVFLLCFNENYKANLHHYLILVEATGLYNITAPDDTDPEEVGKLLSKDLFPFLRASVSTIMTSAGIPPYTIPRSILKP